MYNFYISLNDLNKSILFSKNKKQTISSVSEKSTNSLISYINKEFPLKLNFSNALNETKKFHKEFLENLLKNFILPDKNILHEIKFLKKCLLKIKSNQIVVRPCDKNIGLALFESAIYDNQCLEHLNNPATYKEIYQNPQFLILNECKKTLSTLNSQGKISNQLFKTLNRHIENKKLPSFNIFPKLHKSNVFGIRPIVNCAKTTLSPISKTIDFYLYKIVIQHFSFLKDSQNLIQLTLHKKFSNKDELTTADVEALYTNIPLDPCIIILSDLMTKYPNDHFTPSGFNILLKLVLKNNYFYFRSRTTSNIYFYLQLIGVAMGTACGPSVANCYMAHFELKYYHILRTCLYHRYIDDLLIIKDKNLSIDFKEIFPSLKLTKSSGKIINFLDTNISFDFQYYLNFDLYIKPTNTFSYLSVKSNHPPFIIKQIPKGLIYRIRRICSNIQDYYYHTTVLHKNLVKRGYDSKIIIPLIRSFANQKRQDLLPYKVKKHF